MQADGSRRGGHGRGSSGWLLAPPPSANRLPVAKFVSNGFLINQLGQVDLRLAPQNIRQSVSLARPLILHRMFGLTVEDVWEMMKESPHGERYMEKLLSVEIFGIV